MKRTKIVFLVLALILPVSVFIFLKLFGRNEFQVPVLLQHGTINPPAHCGFNYNTPYQIADSVMTGLGLHESDSLYVFYFDPALVSAINRVSEEFSGDPVRYVSASEISGKADVQFLRECVLLAAPDTSIVVVDHHNRIRGYYKGADRDEIDRLTVEIQIILKQY